MSEEKIINHETPIKLFKFLKEISDLRAKKVFHTDDFEKVIWLSEIPKEREVYSIIHGLNTDEADYKKNIIIKF